MIRMKLYFPLFSIGSIFLGIGSYIILHGLYYGFNDYHKYFFWFSCIGFWCIILSFFINDIELFLLNIDNKKALKKMFK
jgi:hypothetical protein